MAPAPTTSAWTPPIQSPIVRGDRGPDQAGPHAARHLDAGRGGLLLAKRLRRLTPLATIPIIFLTASKMPGLEREAMALGAAAFFEKPYEAVDLLARIEEIFEVGTAAGVH